MPILKIQPNTIDQTANYAFNLVDANTVTVGGVDVITRIQAAYDAANTATGAAEDILARQIANTASGNTIILQGVNTTQNTNITAADTKAQGAFDTSNTATNNIVILQGVNTTQNTNITNADTKAQGAFNKANTGTVLERQYAKPGQLILGDSGTKWYIAANSTITSVIARLDTAPVGDAVSMAIKVNGTSRATLTIGATTTASSLYTTPISVVSGDYVTIEILNIGSVTAGSNLVVTFTYLRG